MKWILRQIFERVARGASTALRVVFADRTAWQAHQGEPDVTIVFRTSSAERRTVLFGYVGFFEAYFDGDVEIEGDRAVGRLMQMAFSGAYRYRANPLLLAKRTYLDDETTTKISRGRRPLASSRQTHDRTPQGRPGWVASWCAALTSEGPLPGRPDRREPAIQPQAHRGVSSNAVHRLLGSLAAQATAATAPRILSEPA